MYFIHLILYVEYFACLFTGCLCFVGLFLLIFHIVELTCCKLTEDSRAINGN